MDGGILHLARQNLQFAFQAHLLIKWGDSCIRFYAVTAV
jgi:hypothetical protein